MTYDELMALRARNEERLKLAKEQLGEKWLLHPKNKVRKFKKADEFIDYAKIEIQKR